MKKRIVLAVFLRDSSVDRVIYVEGVDCRVCRSVALSLYKLSVHSVILIIFHLPQIIYILVCSNSHEKKCD